MLKYILLPLLVGMFLSCGSNEIDISKLKEKNGIFYYENENKPFSGKAASKYLNNQIEIQKIYKNGKLCEKKSYYENGNLKEEEEYKANGNGISKKYYINGKLESQVIFKSKISDDIPYYENGEMNAVDYDENENIISALNIQYLNSNEVNSIRYSAYYNENQKMQRETIMKIGETIDKKYDENGNISHISIRYPNSREEIDYYKNGEKKSEESFDSDNNRNGIYKHYTETGSLYEKGYYLNGKRNGTWYFYDWNGNLQREGDYLNDEKIGIWYEYYNGLKLQQEFKNGKVVKFKYL